MNSLSQTLNSSIARKVVMALTGLFLAAFLAEHLYGNLLLYYNDNGAAFNEYSHTMVHNILIRMVEVFLFAAILLHVAQSIAITRKNNAARPVKYQVRKDGETSNWFSRNMGITGSVIFFFLVVHLRTFFVPYRITGIGEDGSLALVVKEAFANGWYSSFYVAASLILGFHLNHGFQSAFQTLGMNNKQYAGLIRNTGTVFAVVMGAGFASFPIIFYFNLLGR